jgi:hypothetical protein
MNAAPETLLGSSYLCVCLNFSYQSNILLGTFPTRRKIDAVCGLHGAELRIVAGDPSKKKKIHFGPSTQ